MRAKSQCTCDSRLVGIILILYKQSVVVSGSAHTHGSPDTAVEKLLTEENDQTQENLDHNDSSTSKDSLPESTSSQSIPDTDTISDIRDWCKEFNIPHNAVKKLQHTDQIAKLRRPQLETKDSFGQRLCDQQPLLLLNAVVDVIARVSQYPIEVIYSTYTCIRIPTYRGQPIEQTIPF